MEKKKLWIEGLVPAVFTPMNEDGSLNLKVVRPIVEHLLNDGVDALYVCGSTGEGPSLSADERMAVTQAYVDAAENRVPVIVQVGDNSLYQASRLAEHAQKIGASAISSVPPTYFFIDSLDDLLMCLNEITRAAPELPFYYYHIPRLTNINIDIIELLRRGSEILPTLYGVKYSAFAIWEFQAAVELENGRFNLLFGSDEMLLSGLAVGANGAVGSTYNFAAPLYRKIISSFGSGDLAEARKLQGLSVKMIQTLSKHGGSANIGPALKAVMSLIGLDCGPTRLPQVALNSGKLELMKQDLEVIGFFDWAR